jgi:NAD(P)-dependent dehydrogenase (short-subunit alcohol dehydrogenase family)
MEKSVKDAFDLTGRVAIITGGAGLLGVKHAEAIAEAGGRPVLADIDAGRAASAARIISEKYGVDCIGAMADITSRASIEALLQTVLDRFGRIDILINNAANNPKVEKASVHVPAEQVPSGQAQEWSRFENFPLPVWERDLMVGLTGAFLCCQVIGAEMAGRGGGVILNIASDLAVIAPDQRIYRKPGLPEEQQPVKPVTYSVVKSGLLGLTRYLSTYWAGQNVRVNALSPGGVYNGQPDEFVQKLTSLIPMGRMAHSDEYKGAVLFLVSDASSYMTGGNLVIEGGRTVW